MPLKRIPLALLTTLYGVVGAALAESLPTEQKAPSIIEEVVVTARKVTESLRETPVSISAFSELALSQKSVEGMQDIAYLTPGLSYESFVGGNSNVPIIRGMAQSRLNNREQNVSTFIDGVYIQSQGNIDVSLLDLARVEVIKGPQSALYGRNSFAGAINYISKQPGEELQAKLEATAGSDGRRDASAAINLPLTDFLALSVAANESEFDGTFENSHPNAGKPGLLDDHVGGWEKRGRIFGIWLNPLQRLRLSVRRLQFESELDPYPFANLYTNEHPAVANCGQYTNGTQERAVFCGEFDQDFVEFATQVNAIPVDGNKVPIDPRAEKSAIETDMTIANIDVDITESINLQLGYADSDLSNGNLTAVDGDQLEGSSAIEFFQVADLPPVPIPAGNIMVFFAIPVIDQQSEQFEARIKGIFGQRITWSAGAYYSTVDETSEAVFSVTERPGGEEPVNRDNLLVLQKSIFADRIEAAFVSGDYAFTDNLTLSLELRSTDEEKKATNFPTVFQPTGSPQHFEEHYKYTTWRSILDWLRDDGKLYYASLAKGVKGGGFNTDGTAYEEESNITLELGSKFEWRGLRANAALYYTEWDNLQIPVPDANGNPVIVTGNLDGGAKIAGIEFDGQYPLLDNLRLDLGLAYNRARYTDDAVNTSLADSCGANTVCSIEIGGNTLPRQSEKMFNIGAQYFGQVADVLDYFARIDGIYQSEQQVSDRNIATVESRKLVNLRAGIAHPRQGWSLDAWVKNALDREFVTNVIVVNASSNTRQNYGPLLGTRRTMGLTLKYEL